MNTPVSFQLAKLLKEKGFVMPTFYYYENHKLVEPYLENGSSTDTDFRVDLSDLQENFNKWSTKKVSAPTISEVVMWLYEKHGIWVNVTNLSPSHIIWKYQISKKEVGLIHSSEQCPLPPFNYSPTEAYEAAIVYTLNNLI